MANAEVRALLDRLPELHARLRAAEFVPDAARWLAANDLLLRLYGQGRFPGDAVGLRPLLAPLFCSNRTQQLDFSRVFNQWAQGDEAPATPAPVRSAPAAEQGLRRYVQGTRRWPLWVAGFVLLAAIGVGGYFLYRYFLESPVGPVEKPKEPIPTDASEVTDPLKDTGLTPQPIPPRSPPETFRHADEVNALLLGLGYAFAAIPGLIALGWWVDRRRRRRAILRQRAADGDDPLLHLPLSRSGALPYWGGHIPRVLHRLRRGAFMETRQLDIDRTVEATVRDAGMFRTKLLKRRWRPEYVLLIERRHGWDHIAGLGHALANRLEKDGLAVSRYEFRGSPDLCFERTPAGRRTRRLQALQSRHPYARLIALGEADGLFDPLTGAPLEATFKPLRFWPGRAWLTTRAHPWAYREAELSKQGFAVAPLLGAGVEAIADWLESPASKGAAPWFEPEGVEAYPVMFRHDTKQWLQPTPPRQHDLDETLRALRRYVGSAGMDLLTGMAAYPGIHVGLTIALDQKLFPEDGAAVREQRLLRLGRLPWCRHGRMPDYLREKLIRAQSDSKRERMRAAYTAILAERAGVAAGREGWALPIKVPGPRTFRRQLRDWFRFARPDTPLDDRIFANVMLGGRLGLLDFELPKRIAESLPLPRGEFAPLLLALVVALAGAWTALRVWDNTAVPWSEAWVKNEDARYPVRIVPGDSDQSLALALQGALVPWGFNEVTIDSENAKQTNAPAVSDTSVTTHRVEYSSYSGIAAAERVAARLSYLLYAAGSVRAAPVARVSYDQTIVVYLAPTIAAGGVFRDRLTAPYTKPAAETYPTAASTETATASTTPIEPEMIDIPGGVLLMGSPKTEIGRDDDEGPQHKVAVAAFQLAKYEVTFDEYERFARATKRELPSDANWGRGKRPVINVSWNDAQAYTQWLSKETGKTYRLPTEAEWEYAARAGTQTPFSTGPCLSSRQENINNRSAYGTCPVDKVSVGKTVEVGTYPANGFDLHDMHGNVYEWTQDCSHVNYQGAPEDGRAWEKDRGGDCGRRVIRGGSWYGEPGIARSAARNWSDTDVAIYELGFRLARTP